MKKNFLITIILLAFNFSLANQWQEQFAEANAFYKDEQFEKAVASYENIIANGFESGDLYFNLGNAYYKTGNLGKSRLNYERSLLWLEGDDGLKQNLELLKLRLVDQIEPTPKLFINVWWDWVLNLFNIDLLGYLVLILAWLVLIAAALFLHYRKRGRNKFKSLFSTSLTLLIIVITIWVSKIYQFETEEYGIILNSTVTIYAGPADNSTELFVIHEGTKVKIERSNAEWHEIRLEDGKTGWLMQNVLEII